MTGQALVVAAGGLILGLVFGSFLAALIVRWPDGRSVLRGRSACDSCARTLGVGELVPLLSALASGGKCRSCGARIDPLHWQVELGGGLIGLAAAVLAPLPVAFGWMLLGWLLLALAVLDARHYWLPNALTLPLAALGLTIGPWVTGVTLVEAAIGASAGYLSLLLIALGYKWLRGREGLGLGDAKLLGALGAWFGWQALPFIVSSASILALMWALAAAVFQGRKLDGNGQLPLGTFLCIAAVPGAIIAGMLLPG